jgi:hypothetical protein
MNSLPELFYNVDDPCQFFAPSRQNQLLSAGEAP